MKKAVWMLCFLPVLAGCGYDGSLLPEMNSVTQMRPLEKEKSLESNIRFDIGSLEITGDRDPSALYSFDLQYDKSGYAPDVQYDPASGGEEGRLSFSLRSTHKIKRKTEIGGNKLRLAFTDAIPLNLRVSTGVGESRLSLSGLRLSRLDLESGVGETKIFAYEPNPAACGSIRLKNGVGNLEAVGLGNLNFRDLEFEGGVGAATLDFTGEWKQNADIRVQVGVGGVVVRVPRDLGVKVEAQKHLLSGLQLERFTQRDSLYYSENYDTAPFRIFLRIATGIGGLKITWV
jgi:hypothetical protein